MRPPNYVPRLVKTINLQPSKIVTLGKQGALNSRTNEFVLPSERTTLGSRSHIVIRRIPRYFRYAQRRSSLRNTNRVLCTNVNRRTINLYHRRFTFSGNTSSTSVTVIQRVNVLANRDFSNINNGLD